MLKLLSSNKVLVIKIMAGLAKIPSVTLDIKGDLTFDFDTGPFSSTDYKYSILGRTHTSKEIYRDIILSDKGRKLDYSMLNGLVSTPWEIRLGPNLSGFISAEGEDLWEFTIDGDATELRLDVFKPDTLDKGMLECQTILKALPGFSHLLNTGLLEIDAEGVYSPASNLTPPLFEREELQALVMDCISGDIARQTEALWQIQQKLSLVSPTDDKSPWTWTEKICRTLLKATQYIIKSKARIVNGELVIIDDNGIPLAIKSSVFTATVRLNEHTAGWLPKLLRN